LAAELGFCPDAPRQYQCAMALAYPVEAHAPPPCCQITIDPHDGLVELVLGGMPIHRYCLGCAQVIWRFCPCR